MHVFIYVCMYVSTFRYIRRDLEIDTNMYINMNININHKYIYIERERDPPQRALQKKPHYSPSMAIYPPNKISLKVAPPRAQTLATRESFGAEICQVLSRRKTAAEGAEDWVAAT